MPYMMSQMPMGQGPHMRGMVPGGMAPGMVAPNRSVSGSVRNPGMQQIPPSGPMMRHQVEVIIYYSRTSHLHLSDSKVGSSHLKID